MQPEHVIAILRGWYPHWRMILRGFSVQDWLLLGLYLLACIQTVQTLSRRQRHGS